MKVRGMDGEDVHNHVDVHKRAFFPRKWNDYCEYMEARPGAPCMLPIFNKTHIINMRRREVLYYVAVFLKMGQSVSACSAAYFCWYSVFMDDDDNDKKK